MNPLSYLIVSALLNTAPVNVHLTYLISVQSPFRDDAPPAEIHAPMDDNDNSSDSNSVVETHFWILPSADASLTPIACPCNTKTKSKKKHPRWCQFLHVADKCLSIAASIAQVSTGLKH